MSTASSTEPSPKRHRARRVLRRIVRGAIKAFLVVTLLSLTTNALTTPPHTLAAPDGADVVVDGHRVHYRQWGTHGSPVVLVHGFAESTLSWSPVAPLLARDHVVVALDLPGYGYSDRTGHYGLAEEVTTVAGAITALQLNKPAVIGHSLGAAVVGELARTRPNLVSGVIFADGDAMTVPGGRGRGVSWVMRSPYTTSIYRLATRWSWLDERIVRSECGSVCRAYSPGLVEAWMRPLQQGSAEDALPVMAEQPMLAMTPPEVRQIHVPRGIVWGAEDSSGGGSLTGAQADLGHPRTIVLPGAGHLSMVADPDGFARAVTTIISGWPARTN